MKSIAEIEITPTNIVLNGKRLATAETGSKMLHDAYRRYVNDYPKFFKMDGLCKLGFIASELLLKSLDEERFVIREDRAVVLYNHSGSIEADHHYQSTISDTENFFPSPSVFVYTLPNIVTGEIAIRNHYYGETSFFILPQKDETIISQVQRAAFSDPMTNSMMTGWLDYEDDDHFLADMYIMDYE